MTKDATPREVGLSEGLGLAPEREAFERFAQHCPMGCYSVQRKGDGYWSSHTQLMWDAWQAGAAAERERCVQIALDAPMVEPPLEDDPPEVDTALKAMAVSIAARIRGLEPLPRHGQQAALDLKA